jgi:hypothetical protein
MSSIGYVKHMYKPFIYESWTELVLQTFGVILQTLLARTDSLQGRPLVEMTCSLEQGTVFRSVALED